MALTSPESGAQKRRNQNKYQSPCPVSLIVNVFISFQVARLHVWGQHTEHLCGHIGWTVPREPPEDGGMNEMTLPSRHMIRIWNPGNMRLSILPLVTEALHNIESLRVSEEKTVCFFESWSPEWGSNPRSPTFQAGSINHCTKYAIMANTRRRWPQNKPNEDHDPYLLDRNLSYTSSSSSYRVLVYTWVKWSTWGWSVFPEDTSSTHISLCNSSQGVTILFNPYSAGIDFRRQNQVSN